MTCENLSAKSERFKSVGSITIPAEAGVKDADNIKSDGAW